MIARSLGVHLFTFVVAGTVAVQAWLSDPAASEDETRKPVWLGKPEQVERLEFVSERKRLILDSKRDEHGRYFVAELHREKPAPSPDPHGQPPKASNDPPELETLHFVAVTDAEKLAERLAPLEAVRQLGEITDERAADFGFAGKEPARLSVLIGGEKHELLLGDKTPGGGDWYAKTPEGQAFVVDGQIARDLESADGRLQERNLDSWETDEVATVKVVGPTGQRELVRSTEQKGFWADPQSPEDKDETASNWMDKFQRLRIVEYVEQPATGPEPLFSVEFFAKGGRKLGVIDVASRPGDGEDGKPEFVARSQHTRWWGRVLSSTAEQLAQDVNGIVSR